MYLFLSTHYIITLSKQGPGLFSTLCPLEVVLLEVLAPKLFVTYLRPGKYRNRE